MYVYTYILLFMSLLFYSFYVFYSYASILTTMFQAKGGQSQGLKTRGMSASLCSPAGCQATRIIFYNRIFWIESCITEAWSELTLIICIIRYGLCTDYNKLIEEDIFHIVGVFDSIPRVYSLNTTFIYVYQRFWL